MRSSSCAIAPLVHPVNVVLVVPAVYVICSFPMCSVPEESNPDVLLTVIVSTLSVCVVLVVVVFISSSWSYNAIYIFIVI